MSDLKPDYPILQFTSQKAFETWLHKNHTTNGVWLKIAKVGSGVQSVTRGQALDVALCYGWIDGQAKTIDDKFYAQKFTPRRAKSMWSKINIGKVAALTAAGKMQPAGQAQIDAAKADGRWDAAYDSPSTIRMPDDFKAELAKHPKAQAFFAALGKTDAYYFLVQVQMAKTPQTRAARMTKLIEKLNRGEKLH